MDDGLREKFLKLGEEVFFDEFDDTDWDRGFQAGYWTKEAEKEHYLSIISQLEGRLAANVRVMKAEIRKEMEAECFSKEGVTSWVSGLTIHSPIIR